MLKKSYYSWFIWTFTLVTTEHLLLLFIDFNSHHFYTDFLFRLSAHSIMTVASTEQNVYAVQATQPVNTVHLLHRLSASVTRNHCCGDCSDSTLWQITLLAFWSRLIYRGGLQDDQSCRFWLWCLSSKCFTHFCRLIKLVLLWVFATVKCQKSLDEK